METIYSKNRARGFCFARMGSLGIHIEYGEAHPTDPIPYASDLFWKMYRQPMLEPDNMCVPFADPIPVAFPGSDLVFNPR